VLSLGLWKDEKIESQNGMGGKRNSKNGEK
jgi:hypothetical protein